MAQASDSAPQWPRPSSVQQRSSISAQPVRTIVAQPTGLNNQSSCGLQRTAATPVTSFVQRGP